MPQRLNIDGVWEDVFIQVEEALRAYNVPAPRRDILPVFLSAPEWRRTRATAADCAFTVDGRPCKERPRWRALRARVGRYYRDVYVCSAHRKEVMLRADYNR